MSNTTVSFMQEIDVIHEAGLFQGRLGFERAIVLLEVGCRFFSNIQGLGQIRFPAGSISAVFEDIRQVLEHDSYLFNGLLRQVHGSVRSGVETGGKVIGVRPVTAVGSMASHQVLPFLGCAEKPPFTGRAERCGTPSVVEARARAVEPPRPVTQPLCSGRF